MALFSRVQIDPEVKALTGRSRVLASGRSAEGQVVGLVDRLIFRSEGEWRQQAWHQIERGRWDEPTQTLSWVDADGRSWSLPLTETGRLTDLFDERVTASIACLQTVEFEGRRQAVISARRDLADVAGPLLWRVRPAPGTTLTEVTASPVVAGELARLRAEYDLA